MWIMYVGTVRAVDGQPRGQASLGGHAAAIKNVLGSEDPGKCLFKRIGLSSSKNICTPAVIP